MSVRIAVREPDISDELDAEILAERGVGVDRRRRPIRHGTEVGYQRRCRCQPCRSAHAARARARAVNRRERKRRLIADLRVLSIAVRKGRA